MEDYASFHADRAAQLVDIGRARVLVIGCNRGSDCRLMVTRGASAVTGVDVIPQIGAEYADPRVTYVRTAAERLDGIADASHDLVFCHATLEHVSGIEAALREMVRALAPGGAVYCVASPLWRSRYGHHCADLFPEFPWIHLRRDEAEILAWVAEREARGGPGAPPNRIRYFVSGPKLNRRPAADYRAAVAGLAGVEVVRNDFDLDPEDLLTPEIRADLAAHGAPGEPFELLAVTHYAVLRKPKASAGGFWRRLLGG